MGALWSAEKFTPEFLCKQHLAIWLDSKQCSPHTLLSSSSTQLYSLVSACVINDNTHFFSGRTHIFTLKSNAHTKKYYSGRNMRTESGNGMKRGFCLLCSIVFHIVSLASHLDTFIHLKMGFGNTLTVIICQRIQQQQKIHMLFSHPALLQPF